jgi:hypothetical protein
MKPVSREQQSGYVGSQPFHPEATMKVVRLGRRIPIRHLFAEILDSEARRD